MDLINQRIVILLRTAQDLTLLADEGEDAADDDHARALFSEIRDCAYRIRDRAERERELRKKRGIWDCDEADAGGYSI